MHRALACSIALAILALAPPVSADEVVDPSEYGDLLETYVDDRGLVDYDSWADDEEDREALASYLSEVADASVDGHSRDEKLAFYLNAYNALVLHSILEHWPTDGPKSIDGFFEEIEHEVAGESMTLDHLEHGLIRERFEEPRIHFVLVCAARSCPPLLQTPLRGKNLETTLERATESFVSSATKFEEGAVVTSRLFKWFTGDFEEAAGSVRGYLNKYVDDEIDDKLDDDESDLEFRSYDWSLNSQS